MAITSLIYINGPFSGQQIACEETETELVFKDEPTPDPDFPEDLTPQYAPIGLTFDQETLLTLYIGTLEGAQEEEAVAEEGEDGDPEAPTAD